MESKTIQPKLSKEAEYLIEMARERMKKGQIITEDSAKKKLGF